MKRIILIIICLLISIVTLELTTHEVKNEFVVSGWVSDVGNTTGIEIKYVGKLNPFSDY